VCHVPVVSHSTCPPLSSSPQLIAGIVPEEEVNKLQATEQQLQQTKATVTQLEQEFKVQKSAAQAAKVQEAENKSLKEKDVQSQEQMIILKSDLAASQNKTHTFWNN
jgi:outer membrane murein-binding lipoprotein Lpp